MSSLHDACRAGDTERVKQLLDGDGSAQVDEKDEDGWTALGRASYGGQTKVVRLLLDKGALLDDGWTALMSAIDSGDTEVARLLKC
jgi:ankyrin repeat protein